MNYPLKDTFHRGDINEIMMVAGIRLHRLQHVMQAGVDNRVMYRCVAGLAKHDASRRRLLSPGPPAQLFPWKSSDPSSTLFSRRFSSPGPGVLTARRAPSHDGKTTWRHYVTVLTSRSLHHGFMTCLCQWVTASLCDCRDVKVSLHHGSRHRCVRTYGVIRVSRRHCVTTSLLHCRDVNVSLCHGFMASLCPDVTVSQYHSVTPSLSGRHGVTVSRRHGIVVFGRHVAAVSQRHSVTASRQHSVTVGTSECHGVSDVTASEYHGVTVSGWRDGIMLQGATPQRRRGVTASVHHDV